jgi:hypothetical protein
MQGVVLCMTKFEIITLFQVDGAGVGIKKFPHPSQDSLQENIQVFYLINIQTYLGNKIDFFCFHNACQTPGSKWVLMGMGFNPPEADES